jgi:hypothetical protein
LSTETESEWQRLAICFLFLIARFDLKPTFDAQIEGATFMKQPFELLIDLNQLKFHSLFETVLLVFRLSSAWMSKPQTKNCQQPLLPTKAFLLHLLQ